MRGREGCCKRGGGRWENGNEKEEERGAGGERRRGRGEEEGVQYKGGKGEGKGEGKGGKNISKNYGSLAIIMRK